jgi:hypothetical protein
VLRHDWNSYHYRENFPPSEKVNRTADLDAALEFVIGRIEEQATRSDEPLSDGQRFLLNHLPTVSALPPADGADPESPMLLLPPDIEYEALWASKSRAPQ